MQPYWKIYGISSKNRNRITMLSSNPLSEYISKKKFEIRNSKRRMYSPAPFNIIHKVHEPIQCP
jgi:hypothetical protein